jgi:ABC-type antimicrobial peptide transport system permease subunit
MILSNSGFQEAAREFRRRPHRSLTAVAGYLLITAFVVLVLNVLLAAQAAKQRYLTNLGTHFLVSFPQPQTGPQAAVHADRLLAPHLEGFFSDPALTRLFPLRNVDSIKNLPQILAASPFLLFRFQDPQSREIFCLGGFDPGNPVAVNGTSLQKSNVIRGDFLTPADRGQALLEEGYAVYRELDVGATLTVGSFPFTVKGIVRPGIRPAKADIYVPFVEAQAAISTRLTRPLHDEANVILVEVATASEQLAAMTAVKQLFPESMINTYDCFQPATQTTRIDTVSTRLALFVLVTVLLLFAAKVQWTGVTEKRHDIGILRAIGWTDGRVIRLILAESFLQAFSGGALGCLIGAGLTTLAGMYLLPQQGVYPGIAAAGAGLVLAILGAGLTALVVGRVMVAAAPASNLKR